MAEMLSGKLDELDMELAEESELEGKGGLQGMLGGITKVFKK